MPTGNNEILEETTQITEATTEANATLSSASINMQNIDDDNKDNSSGNNDTNGSNNDLKGQICGTKLPTGTFDPTPYIQRARVTRPAPPKPSCNPMQFVQIKPCNLYQSAQEQIKRAEEVKKVKEVKKEDPEDWQNNLDNWKSSRRKRVEHIIDRVVEVKKLELEEHDRSRRKSKTFSEMLEERTTKGRTNKLASLAVYTEDESNDLSDLGIGTSSTSGKSSLSEDYDNNSVLSDNADTEKTPTNFKSDNNSNDGDLSENGGATREYISSPGYDTSSSTAPASSPDPCEYTYEGAIEDYKSRISKAVASSSKNSFNNNINNNNNNITNTNNNNNNMNSNANIYRNNKDSTIPERTLEQYLPRRMSGTKIEDRLMNFEIKSSGDANESISTSNISKKDLPKVDILKRRELFEKENSPSSSSNDTPTKERRFSGATAGADIQNTKTIRERLSSLEKKPSLEEDNKKKVNRLSDNNTTSSDKGTRSLATNKIVDVPVLSLKDRLSSLQSAVAKEEIKKPVMLIDEHQLEILKKEDFEKQQALKRISNISSNTSSTTGTTPNTIITINTTPAINTDDEQHSNSSHEILSIPDESNVDTDREDSGIHTTDVSCSVSQTDEQAELVNEENHHQHPINIDNLHHHHHHHDHEHHNNLHQNNNDHPEHNSHKLHSISNNATIINDTDKTKLSLEIVDQRNSTNDQNILSNQNKFNNAVNNSLESHETTTDNDVDISVSEAIEMALKAIDTETPDDEEKPKTASLNINDEEQQQKISTQLLLEENEISTTTTTTTIITNQFNNKNEPIYENFNDTQNVTMSDTIKQNSSPIKQIQTAITQQNNTQLIGNTKQLQDVNPIINALAATSLNSYPNINTKFILNETITKPTPTNILDEPYYSVPKPSEPYYEVPKAPRPIPVYENIDLFYNQISLQTDDGNLTAMFNNSNNVNGIDSLEPPKEKPPPPPIDDLSDNDADVDDEDLNKNGYGNDYHTYETIDNHKKKCITNSVDQIDGNNSSNNQNQKDIQNYKPVKRMNSTKRIKKELRNKRSSFLGIEGTNDDDSFLELTVAPPPDMVKLLQEERRLEKQLYIKAGLYDSSDAADSRDSGVSENHSRQSSEPFTNSSEEHEDLLKKKEKEIIEVLEKEEEKQKQNKTDNWQESQSTSDPETKMQCIEDQIREQEEVLRVERELLQLEQEELKRQRENLMLRENIARQELQHGAKMLMSATRRSLLDINTPIPQTAVQQQQQLSSKLPIDENLSSATNVNHYANLPAHQIYQCVETDYRKSMSDLNDYSPSRQMAHNNLSIVTTLTSSIPAAPAKPIRSSLSIDAGNLKTIPNGHIPNYIPNGGGLVKIANSPTHNNNINGQSALTNTRLQHSQSTDDFVPLRNYQINTALHNGGNMTRNTLLALSATPKPKYTDAWVQQSTQQNHSKLTHQSISADRAHEAWLNQQKRKSVPDNFNYNKHWLIQEAEQRRIDQQRGLSRQNYNGVSNATTISTNGWTNSAIQRNGSSDNKPLPDSVIQTITQRVQSKGIGERKRLEAISTESLNSSSNSIMNSRTVNSPINSSSHNDGQNLSQTQQDKVLSVSGRKKCSHCGEELGRGAAMIIESLRLFYHISCFKCCVCHVQLGDGLNGTDVRVRNQKLHCQNCYSSDDGIKFSCV
ncbi:probable serine/threonine-protein kinase DDB_G0282963 isoform X2 [Condylostylus longicornis]|uniref:probable serine/threonine-protein kinase DDB_G0282963 isoform X2 n=1 Tax=Condylostylus longicornis TaxID=2530218 RepID=UPI00244D9BD9|nr:probable serine/threonine-protein kinase DDB_G0282963 isoform X2 [Condylostylus longicornis]